MTYVYWHLFGCKLSFLIAWLLLVAVVGTIIYFFAGWDVKWYFLAVIIFRPISQHFKNEGKYMCSYCDCWR